MSHKQANLQADNVLVDNTTNVPTEFYQLGVLSSAKGAYDEGQSGQTNEMVSPAVAGATRAAGGLVVEPQIIYTILSVYNELRRHGRTRGPFG